MGLISESQVELTDMAEDVTNSDTQIANPRQILKDWKSEFIQNNGRSPTKGDFKTAPDYVQKAGKLYNERKPKPFSSANFTKLVNTDIPLTLQKSKKRRKPEGVPEVDSTKSKDNEISDEKENIEKNNLDTMELLSNFPKKQKTTKNKPTFKSSI